jgi:hypothetical protein
MLLVGSPKPERSTGRRQKKSSSLAFQVGGCAVGLVIDAHKDYTYCEAPMINNDHCISAQV